MKLQELTSIAKLKMWTYPTSSLIIVEVQELTSMAEQEKREKGTYPTSSLVVMEIQELTSIAKL